MTWTATDVSGNSSTVTVIVQDTPPPSLTVPANVVVECSAQGGQAVTIGQATGSDIYGPVTITNDAPGTFSLGTIQVTWTATDGSGNKTTGTQDVTVEDTTKPSLTVPANVAVECSLRVVKQWILVRPQPPISVMRVLSLRTMRPPRFPLAAQRWRGRLPMGVAIRPAGPRR